MKFIRLMFCLLIVLLFESANASLSVHVSDPQSIGGEVVIKLTIKNIFEQKVESARAVVFLMDETGKVAGQNTEWVIGGTKDKPALLPQATTTYNIVIKTDKPFKKTSVLFTRIILEDGTIIEAGKGFEIEK